MNECLTLPQHEKQIGYWVSEKGKCMKWLLTVNEDKCSTTFRYLVTKYPWSYICALHVSVYFALQVYLCTARFCILLMVFILQVFFSVQIAAFALGNASPGVQSWAVARGAAHIIFHIIDLVRLSHDLSSISHHRPGTSLSRPQ